jgi:hypothetical protein
MKDHKMSLSTSTQTPKQKAGLALSDRYNVTIGSPAIFQKKQDNLKVAQREY